MRRSVFLLGTLLSGVAMNLAYGQESGVELAWARHYEGPVSQAQAVAMDIDAEGNVYVTGWCSTVDNGKDYVTIKYTPDGAEQWVARYNGPGTSDDVPGGLILDDVGGVYVTGGSIGQITDSDYATVKYDSEGTEQWVLRYNGPIDSTDIATAIALDQSGGFYVTGTSVGVDSSGDFLTLKYAYDGTERWQARYSGVAAGAQDEPATIAIGQTGDVYVAGTSGFYFSKSFVARKYSQVGEEQWDSTDGVHREVSVGGMSIDRDGNAYIGGSLNWGSFVTKYNHAVSREWISTIFATMGDAGVTELALDMARNVYTVGWYHQIASGGYGDYLIAKYDSLGAEQWRRLYHVGHDEAKGVALDSLGCVYVTGDANTGTVRLIDWLTLKYDTDGELQWKVFYNGSGDAFDYANDIAVDRWGNVYVTGYSETGDQSILTTVKYTQEQTVDVKTEKTASPSSYLLSQNHPNPVDCDLTTIRYALAVPSFVTLQVFNLRGQQVAMLVSEQQPAGVYDVPWRPSNLPAGVYFYRLNTGRSTATRKSVLLK